MAGLKLIVPGLWYHKSLDSEPVGTSELESWSRGSHSDSALVKAEEAEVGVPTEDTWNILDCSC